MFNYGSDSAVPEAHPVGIRRESWWVIEHNPKHQGRGLQRHARGGESRSRRVSLTDQCTELNVGSIAGSTTQRPWLIAKMHQILDGRISRRK